MTTPTAETDRICAAPGCSMPVWDGLRYCPRHALLGEELAPIAAGNADDEPIIVSERTAAIVQAWGFRERSRYERHGRIAVSIYLDD